MYGCGLVILVDMYEMKNIWILKLNVMGKGIWLRNFIFFL